MSVVACRFNDRFGNRLQKYAFARAYAERIGAELQTDAWHGQRIFGLTEKPIEREFDKVADLDFEQWDGKGDVEITGWCLHQKNLIYSRADAKRWLRLAPEIEEAVKDIRQEEVAIHLRWGDYKHTDNYICISILAYEKAIRDNLGGDVTYQTVCEWKPTQNRAFDKMELEYVADFVTLMRAKNLFRGNSTFSYWAAVLGDNERVFSPRLKGIAPKQGDFQMVPFTEGNHNAISALHYNHTDLNLRET